MNSPAIGNGQRNIALTEDRADPLPFFDRDAWRAWSPMLYHVVEAHVPAEVLGRFSDDVEPGWIEWLHKETSRATGRTCDLVDSIRSALRVHFAGIRVFHGTRLTSLEDVATRGFVAWDEASLKQAARARFGGIVQAQALERAIAQARPDVRAGAVYTFSALSVALGVYDDDDPVGVIPAFAAAGGEWLRAVARHMDADVAVAPAPATGYLFALDIPWRQCSDDTQRSIAQHALTTSLISARLDHSRYRMASGIDCVDISSDVPASAIAAFAEIDRVEGRPIRPDELRWTPWPP